MMGSNSQTWMVNTDFADISSLNLIVMDMVPSSTVESTSQILTPSMSVAFYFPQQKTGKKISKITEVIEDDRRFLLQLQTHFVDLRLDRAFRGHRGPVTCIAFHPQEQQVHTARYAARVARVCTMLDTDSQIVSVKLHLVACCNICQILFPKVTLKLHKNWNGAILKPGVVLQPLQPRTRLSQALRTDVCSFGSRHGFRQVKFYKRWIQYAHAYTAKILKKKNRIQQIDLAESPTEM